MYRLSKHCSLIRLANFTIWSAFAAIALADAIMSDLFCRTHDTDNA